MNIWDGKANARLLRFWYVMWDSNNFTSFSSLEFLEPLKKPSRAIPLLLLLPWWTCWVSRSVLWARCKYSRSIFPYLLRENYKGNDQEDTRSTLVLLRGRSCNNDLWKFALSLEFASVLSSFEPRFRTEGKLNQWNKFKKTPWVYFYFSKCWIASDNWIKARKIAKKSRPNEYFDNFKVMLHSYQFPKILYSGESTFVQMSFSQLVCCLLL